MTRVVYVQNHDKGILPEKQIAVTNGAAARMLGISPRHALQLARAGSRAQVHKGRLPPLSGAVPRMRYRGLARLPSG